MWFIGQTCVMLLAPRKCFVEPNGFNTSDRAIRSNLSSLLVDENNSVYGKDFRYYRWCGGKV